MQKESLTYPRRMPPFTRRQFLRQTSVALGAAAMYFPYVGRVLGANDRINVACIGVGGKGNEDSSNAAECGGNIVAICDVDSGHLGKKVARSEEHTSEL